MEEWLVKGAVLGRNRNSALGAVFVTEGYVY